MDMAVLYGARPEIGLCSQPLMKEDLYLVGTHAVPNPGKYVDLSDVAKLNLFMPRSYNVMRRLVDDAMAIRRLSANVIGEIESSATLTAAVASGLGATILPESAARAMTGPAKAWMSCISSPAIQVPLSLCVSETLALSQEAMAVKKILLGLVAEQTVPVLEPMLAAS
jgi:LysR family nitrogen assimilation transcriptional regulator